MQQACLLANQCNYMFARFLHTVRVMRSKSRGEHVLQLVSRDVRGQVAHEKLPLAWVSRDVRGQVAHEKLHLTLAWHGVHVANLEKNLEAHVNLPPDTPLTFRITLTRLPKLSTKIGSPKGDGIACLKHSTFLKVDVLNTHHTMK